MSTDTKQDKILDYLKAEIAKSEKSAQRMWMFGLPVVLIVFGYLAYINIQLNSLVLNSGNLAHVAALKLDSNIPGMLNQLEKNLTEQAPDLTKILFNELLGMVDVVEASGRQSVDIVVDLMPVLDDHAKQAVDTYFNLHGAEIKTFFENHQDEKFVQAFVNELLLGMAKQLAADYEVQRMQGGRSFETLTQVSLVNLQDLNHQLAAMIKQHPIHMTPRERLQRRLIVAWVNALGKELDLDFSTYQPDQKAANG